MNQSPTCFDLILENGELVWGVPPEHTSQTNTFNGKKVQKRLRIAGIYRWPLLGPVLRNGWAKKKRRPIGLISEPIRNLIRRLNPTEFSGSF